MEMNENFVTEQVAENVEQTTEQTPKTYTQEEVDGMMGKRVARIQKQHNREMEQYRELEGVLRAGMGKEDIGEITNDLRTFYGERKGIKMPQNQEYTEQDVEFLASNDAKVIIGEGNAEEEFARLEAKGSKMTKREQHTFRHLAEHLQDAKNYSELEKIGVTKEEYYSDGYQEFRKQFNPNIPEERRYKMYQQNQPKKEIRTMGSMKSNPTTDNGVKDFYTVEEARRFTKADYDKNPALFEAVQKSMTKWK